MATRVAGKFEPSARLTPANAITLLRILATPVIVVLIVDVGISWAAAVAWLVLASTDFLDGWVARRQGATTSGAFLDPLADKFLVLGALAALAGEGYVSWWPVLVIALREALISAYRSMIAGRGISMPARPLAKAKTAVQDLAVGLVLLPLHSLSVGRVVLWVAVVLAVASAGQYLLDSRARQPSVAIPASPAPPG